ncbi:MAG: hypothetical protein ACK48U_10380, partial [Planctomyces sp.]
EHEHASYSCPFVVQNTPPRSPFRTDLGLESPSYLHSWFIRGSFGKRWSLTTGHRTDQRSVVAAPTAGRTISVW